MSLRCQAHRLMPRAAIERFQEWVYQTDHPIEALIGENYFLGVRDRLLKGDVVEIYAVGTDEVRHMRLLVSQSDRQCVAVAPFTADPKADGFHVQQANFIGPGFSTKTKPDNSAGPKRKENSKKRSD